MGAYFWISTHISPKISPKDLFFLFLFFGLLCKKSGKMNEKNEENLQILDVNKRDQKDEFEDKTPWYTKFGKGEITP